MVGVKLAVVDDKAVPKLPVVSVNGPYHSYVTPPAGVAVNVGIGCPVQITTVLGAMAAVGFGEMLTVAVDVSSGQGAVPETV